MSIAKKNLPYIFDANLKAEIMRKTVFSLSLAALIPVMAIAHPGHGLSNGHDWTHYLASAGHAMPGIIAGGLILVIVFQSFREFIAISGKKR